MQRCCDRYQPFRRLSRNSATIRPHHCTCPTQGSHITPPRSRRPGGEQLEPHPAAQTQVLDEPRKAPTAHNISLLFLLGLSHASAQRQTEIKPAPPTSFFRSSNPERSGVRAGGARGAAAQAGGSIARPDPTSPGLLAAGRRGFGP